MTNYDKDTDWSKAHGMKMCVCKHLEKSHRPMSRKCIHCDCKEFKPEAAPKN